MTTEKKSEADMQSLADKISAVKDKLESAKALYAELDTLIIELSSCAKHGRVLKTSDKRFIMLLDNFAEKNTVFRPTGVKRFDVELMDEVEWVKKQNKEAARSKCLNNTEGKSSG